MVRWQFCSCGKVVDEYEDKCYWCGTSVDAPPEVAVAPAGPTAAKPNIKDAQMRLF